MYLICTVIVAGFIIYKIVEFCLRLFDINSYILRNELQDIDYSHLNLSKLLPYTTFSTRLDQGFRARGVVWFERLVNLVIKRELIRRGLSSALSEKFSLQ